MSELETLRSLVEDNEVILTESGEVYLGIFSWGEYEDLSWETKCVGISLEDENLVTVYVKLFEVKYKISDIENDNEKN